MPNSARTGERRIMSEQTKTSTEEAKTKEEIKEVEVTEGEPGDYLEEKTNDAVEDVETLKTELETTKKRYGDSSREAQKIKKELDELVAFINEDDELKDLVQKKISGNTEKKVNVDTYVEKESGDLSEVKQEIAALKKEKNEEAIKRFEAKAKEKGVTFTPEFRQQMKPDVTRLTKAGYTLGEALGLALLKTGKAKTNLNYKFNEDATYSTSNSTKGKSETVTLSKEEQRVFDKMPGTPEEKKEILKFMKK